MLADQLMAPADAYVTIRRGFKVGFVLSVANIIGNVNLRFRKKQ